MEMSWEINQAISFAGIVSSGQSNVHIGNVIASAIACGDDVDRDERSAHAHSDLRRRFSGFFQGPDWYDRSFID